jgi:hypothetical protein
VKKQKTTWQEEYPLGAVMARSLFLYKGNPASFECTEEQLARIIQGSIDWADNTRDNFNRDRPADRAQR